MTSNYHTPIAEGAAANSQTFNDPLGQMDEALSEALLLERDGHIIQDEGVDLAQQPRINFVGAGVTATNTPGKTVITIPGGGTDHGALTGLSDPDHVAGSIAFTATDKVLGRSTSGAGAGEEIPLTAAGRALMAGASASAQRTTLDVDQILYPNLAINGGLNYAQWLATPGTYTTISDNSYCADRYRVTRENADVQFKQEDATGETGLTSRYFGTLKKITNAGKIHVCQPFKGENSVPLRGRSVTFQIKLKASSSKNIRLAILELQNAGTIDTIPATLITAWGADGTNPTLGTNVAIIGASETKAVTTSWQLFSVTVTIPSNSKNILPAFWADADFAVNDTISWAEFYVHTAATTQTWNDPDPELDFSRCTLFAERISGLSTGVAIASGMVETSSSSFFFLNYIKKRTSSPTITFSAVGDFRVRYSAGNSVATAITTTVSADRAQLNVTPTGTPLTAGHGVVLQAVNTSASILISSEL